jgi:methyltransferase (TIGR00027 family)
VTPDLSGVHGTAVLSAALRAWHTTSGAEPKIFRDELALPLSGMAESEVVAFAEGVQPESASTCILRSRFTEDRLEAARGRVTQYVILGAGLDSFALRMGDTLGALEVFEVDEPSFQEFKMQRIRDLRLEVPAQLHFVPCDFETSTIAEALAARDFVPDEPCFVSWLGVTQYLTRTAVSDTLSWAGRRPAGSELVLTYLESNERAAQLQQNATRSGVTFVSTFSVPEITEMVSAAGFSQIEHLSPEDAQERYFRGRTDGLRAPAIQRLLSATV